MSILPIFEGKSSKTPKKIKSNSIIVIALVALILTMSSIVTSYDQQSAFGQAYPGVNRDIVYSSNYRGGEFSGDYDIWRIIGGTETPRIVLDDLGHPADDFSPSLSPDGREIVFVSKKDSLYGDIYRMDINGGNLVRLTQEGNDFPVGYPSFSPDGSKIVYSKTIPEGASAGHADIMVMNRDGGGKRPLTSHTGYAAYDYYPSWSPDGSKILFESDRQNGRQIYVMDFTPSGTDVNVVRQTNFARFLNSGVQAQNIEPSWSPDGIKIVFASNFRNNDWNIYRMDFVPGREATNFTPVIVNDCPNTNDLHPSWSPDGRNIVFQSNAEHSSGNVGVALPCLRWTGEDDYELWTVDANLPCVVFTDMAYVNPNLSCSRTLTHNGDTDQEPYWGGVDLFQSFIPIIYQYRIYTLIIPPNPPDSHHIPTGPISVDPGAIALGVKSHPPPGACGPDDSDRDGILNNVDTLPRRFSTIFSDESTGGLTSGTISMRGTERFCIADQAPRNNQDQGVRIYTVGPPSGSSGEQTQIRAPLSSDIECREMSGRWGVVTIPVIAPYDSVLTCRRGSVILDLEVMQGTTNTTVVADDGSTAKLELTGPNSTASFDTTTGTLTAGQDNINPLNVTFVVGGVVEQEPRQLLPGDSLVVDTIPPETAIDTATTDSQGKYPIQDGNTTSSQNIIFQFSSPDSDVSVIECSLDNKTWEACTNNVAAYDNLSDGRHFFSVRAKDAAGNVDSTPYVVSWTIDTTPPATAIDSATTDSQGKIPIQNQSSTLPP